MKGPQYRIVPLMLPLNILNSAIALAQHPELMAEAMHQGVKAGYKALLAGRLRMRIEANPSSPTVGISHT